MKKRLTAFVLAILMLISLSPASYAAETVYFTAVDERVLDLNDATMPFWFAGYLYVAASLFQESGLGYSYNTIKQTLVLYESSRSLVFDLATGSATDGQGTPYPHVAVTRGGVTFLPVSAVSSYFNRTYSNNHVSHGYLIRVRTSGSLSDAIFLDAASYQLESRYQQYHGQRTDTEPPLVEPTIPEDPQPTDTVPRKSIYLCFLVEDTVQIDQWLDVLNTFGVRASFYFTEEALTRCGDQLRRLTAVGQTIGLELPAGSESPQETLSRMNELLFFEAGVKTRLVYAGADANTAVLREAGYSPLIPRLNRSAYGLATSKGAAALLHQAEILHGAVTIWLGGNVTPNGLREFISDAEVNNNRLLTMTET